MKKFINKTTVSLNKLELLDYNPRYNDILKIEWNKIREKGSSMLEIDIALEILKYEDDFSSFKTLLKSISNGYNDGMDIIICMQTPKNKYVVIEGNRRLLALKMLADEKWAKNVLDSLKSFYTDDDETLGSESDEDVFEANFETKNIISEINSLYNFLININIEKGHPISFDLKITIQNIIYENKKFSEDEIRLLLDMILSRSVSAPGGKLKWPRFQTLANTLNVYKLNYSNLHKKDDSIKKTAEYLNRSISSISKELEGATFIMNLIENYEGKFEKYDWKKLKTSAIELSISQISLVSINGFTNLKEFLQISTNVEEGKVKIENSEYDIKKLSTFLIDNFLEFNYSTRGWKKDKNKKPLYDFVKIQISMEESLYLLTKNKNHTHHELAKEITKQNETIKNYIHNIKKEKIPNVKEIHFSYEKSSLNILRKYYYRLLEQEVRILTYENSEVNLFNYPYYSLISIARNTYELLISYLFVEDKDIRNLLMQKLKNSEWFFNYYNGKSDREIFELVYKVFKTKSWQNIGTKFKSIWDDSTFKQDFFKIISNSVKFNRFYDSIENILVEFDNKTFNVVVHKPYKYAYKENISEIPLLIKKSLEIIKNFSIILELDN